MRISDWSSDVCSADLRTRTRCALITRRRWWRMTGSNRRPPACKAGALPAELIPRSDKIVLVGQVGIEPTTPEIGRASCRERECQSVKYHVGDVTVQNKKSRI